MNGRWRKADVLFVADGGKRLCSGRLVGGLLGGGMCGVRHVGGKGMVRGGDEIWWGLKCLFKAGKVIGVPKRLVLE